MLNKESFARIEICKSCSHLKFSSFSTKDPSLGNLPSLNIRLPSDTFLDPVPRDENDQDCSIPVIKIVLLHKKLLRIQTGYHYEKTIYTHVAPETNVSTALAFVKQVRMVMREVEAQIMVTSRRTVVLSALIMIIGASNMTMTIQATRSRVNLCTNETGSIDIFGSSEKSHCDC